VPDSRADETGAASPRWSLIVLATGFAAAMVLGLGAAQAARTPSSPYAHTYRVSGTPNGEVYTMNADGSEQTNLTADPNSDDSFPAWSHDGSRIAWTQVSLGNGDAEIFSMAADQPVTAARHDQAPELLGQAGGRQTVARGQLQRGVGSQPAPLGYARLAEM
jgi:hypothetical protein